ncbi:MAG: ABC transporter permease [Halodesulfurarchaeum sp.]
MGYYVRRIAQAVITLIAGMFVTFALYRLIPGGPLEAIQRQLAQRMIQQRGQVNPEILARQTELLVGINPDKPFYISFFEYVRDIVLYQDFGQSILYNRPVFNVMFEGLPWSIFISSYGLILGYTATIVLGAVMAWYEGTKLDSGLTGFVLTMNSIPYYVVAILMLVVLGFQLELLPTGGRYGSNIDPGFTLKFMVSVARHAAMPIASTFVVGFAAGSLQMRGNAVRVMGSDFLRSANIRGISTNRIVTKYLTRNAVLPIYTGMMVGIARLFSSSVVTEQIFQYPGVGWYMFEALMNQDYPLLMGGFLFFSIITILGILFADLTYGLIDPRAGTGASRESF